MSVERLREGKEAASGSGQKHPRRSRATSLQTASVCHTKPSSPNPPQRLGWASGPRYRLVPPSSAEKAVAEPRTGQAAALAPLPPADTGRARPRALALRFGSPAAGEGVAGSGSQRRSGHGAPPCPLLFRPPRQPVTTLAAAPAPHSTAHMFRLRLLAWLPMSHGQGKEVPGTKGGSETRNLHACGGSDGGCRKKRYSSPFSVLCGRSSVTCRYHNASSWLLQESRGASLHSPTYHSRANYA